MDQITALKPSSHQIGKTVRSAVRGQVALSRRRLCFTGLPGDLLRQCRSHIRSGDILLLGNDLSRVDRRLAGTGLFGSGPDAREGNAGAAAREPQIAEEAAFADQNSSDYRDTNLL